MRGPISSPLSYELSYGGGGVRTRLHKLSDRVRLRMVIR